MPETMRVDPALDPGSSRQSLEDFAHTPNAEVPSYTRKDEIAACWTDRQPRFNRRLRDRGQKDEPALSPFLGHPCPAVFQI
jgi:hypothetical protein